MCMVVRPIRSTWGEVHHGGLRWRSLADAQVVVRRAGPKLLHWRLGGGEGINTDGGRLRWGGRVELQWLGRQWRGRPWRIRNLVREQARGLDKIEYRVEREGSQAWGTHLEGYVGILG